MNTDDGEFRDEFGNWISDAMKEAWARELIPEGKMAERKEVAGTREFAFRFGIAVGKRKGYHKGFTKGLAWGIGGMVLFYATVHALFGIFS